MPILSPRPRRNPGPQGVWRVFLAAAAALASTPAPGAPATEPPAHLALPADRPPHVGFLLVDGVYNTELVAPWDVFEHTVHHAGAARGLRVFAISADGGPVTTAEGLRIAADYSFADHPPVDILVVASAEGSRDRDLANRALIEWVRTTGGSAQMVMSLCWGAFVLAEAGLLDGRAATTFPSDYGTFGDRFPDLDLRTGVNFVHDGRALTSQGGARSYDAAIYLVERIYGEEVARGIAAGLLLDWPAGTRDRPPAISDPDFVVHPPREP